MEIDKIREEYKNKQSHLLNDLHYPNAKEWMWNYCIPLGKWYCRESKRDYDLGIHIDELGISAANVYDNRDGSYLSGSLHFFKSEIYHETMKRAIDLFGEELYKSILNKKK